MEKDGPGRDYQCPRLFFWVPSDATDDQRVTLVKEAVDKAWVNMASPHNGGWQAVLPKRGDLQVSVLGPIRDIPSFHSLYSEGMDTYLVRDAVNHQHLDDRGIYKDVLGRKFRVCNRIRFWRDQKARVIHLPDRIMLTMMKAGLVQVLDWDDPDGEEAVEAWEFLAWKAAGEQPVVEERGETVKTAVPW